MSKTGYEPLVEEVRISRRAVLRGASLLIGGGLALESARACAADPEPRVQVGLVTDLHYADREPAGTRHYRDTLAKADEAVARFNERGVSVVVELGDFIDAAETVETELGYLDRVNEAFKRLRADRKYVLGNHCVWTLTKPQFLERVGMQSGHYSFDRSGVHFVVLDACYRADGVPYGDKNFTWTDTEILPAQRDWLRTDLERAAAPTVVFVHQRLDVENQYGVKSAPEVRRLLEASGKVMAVLQGHSHKNEHQERNGIHYCTLAAMVEGAGAENNSYGVLSVYPDRTLKLDGFRRQQSYAFPSPD